MIQNKKTILISLASRKVELIIYGEKENEETIFEKKDAFENGEAAFQIMEGCFYEYRIDEGFSLQTSEIVSQSKINKSSGRIAPNIYVGTLSIDVIEFTSDKKCGEVKLEVQSKKTSYREDYRLMLEEITEKCTDLLLQHSSPVSQYFEVDFNADSATLYQRFAFIKSIIGSEEFNDSVQKILSTPITKWKEEETIKDIRSIRRINNSSLRQICSATNRIKLPDSHPLHNTIHSIPSKLKVNYKTETVDTPENRFVKYALTSFQLLCNDFRNKVKDDNRLKAEAGLLEDQLERYLSHSVFKEISLPNTLPLNSPVLQRKEGYRGILRIWLMFDLAARLVWHGGEDVYSGNKRDVAVLYEYWLFFKLLELVKEVFKIDPKSIEDLIRPTKDGLGLQLRQGKYLPIKGIYHGKTRKLEVEFSYNKTFSGNNEYPQGGSWTRSMRPDYTLSIWPLGISSKEAELEELIVHIHFDAKYKIEKLTEILGSDDDLETEKEEQNKGTYKHADLLKMHAYKDAIRRTGGAYILYPGTETEFTKIGFHEIIPGLGAFSIRPSKTNNGTEELKKFLHEIVHHFLNRASQREKMSLDVYKTYKSDQINEVNENLPEAYGANRSLLPDETFVLVGFYKNEAQLKWILRRNLYNARTGSSRGSLRFKPEETQAKYLLLHTTGETKTNKIFRLDNNGPRIFSKEDLIKMSYPDPSQNFYLVYDITDTAEKELKNIEWDITRLRRFSKGRGSALPFAVSLSELFKKDK